MNKDIDAQCADGAQFHVFTASEEGLLRVSSSLIVVEGLRLLNCLSPALSGPHRSAVRCNRRLPRATTGEMIRGV